MVFARVVKEKVTTHKSTGKLTKTGIPFGLTVELVNGAACIYSPFVVPPLGLVVTTVEWNRHP